MCKVLALVFRVFLTTFQHESWCNLRATSQVFPWIAVQKGYSSVWDHAARSVDMRVDPCINGYINYLLPTLSFLQSSFGHLSTDPDCPSERYLLYREWAHPKNILKLQPLDFIRLVDVNEQHGAVSGEDQAGCRRRFFIRRVIRHWNRLPGTVVTALSCQTSRSTWTVVSDMGFGFWVLSEAGSWTRGSLLVLSNSEHLFSDSVLRLWLD